MPPLSVDPVALANTIGNYHRALVTENIPGELIPDLVLAFSAAQLQQAQIAAQYQSAHTTQPTTVS